MCGRYRLTNADRNEDYDRGFMFHRQILIIVAAILLTNAPAFPADSTPSPSKAEALVKICRELVDDMSRFAEQGDADIDHLLDVYRLKGDVNWAAMAKDQRKVETMLQYLCMDLLRLQEHNDHARAIIAKFKIEQAASANPPN